MHLVLKSKSRVSWEPAHGLTIDNGAAVGVDSLTADRAAVVAGQEDKASSNLTRLRRPADWRGELLDSLIVHSRWDEWGPDRAGGNSVDANTLSDVLV